MDLLRFVGSRKTRSEIALATSESPLQDQPRATGFSLNKHHVAMDRIGPISLLGDVLYEIRKAGSKA